MTDTVLTTEYIRTHLDTRHTADGGITQIFRDAEGTVQSSVYHLFPGITLIHKEVYRPYFLSNWRKKPERGFVIEHCWKGRLECQMGTACMYPAPGDIILYRTDYSPKLQHFPLGCFCSMAVSVDLDALPPALSDRLESAGLYLDSIIAQYRLDQCFYQILRDTVPLVRIFEDIHHTPETVKLPYWKLKVMELLLLLNTCVPANSSPSLRRISGTQADAAKAARQYLLDHPYERITIDALAALLRISPSHLKAGFRAVYGTSIKHFDLEHKMQIAAQLLRETSRPVGDIARQFGYINTSKFSSAFTAVHGKIPSEYRVTHRPRHP